ncbi:2,3-bisphosphoglycerate-dependent phosphoglycerate mutase [Chlamydia gallinacea]|uniref:2,3-bisphosphoglycerate-dependent phosphoglycerate mutase n=2 Tax=Chlamydia gallinacea TaxID=1457153 RepID=A0A173DYF2_9CHLA|nr:2,3-bisphosphoglycerate-dependent phosphoglycerate mutase [Chlamydia gallinacea]ANG65969.1 phosphoglycerate mutase [Chlamydia gallinacea 08-1274/3]EYE60722.1 phosphoglycerate mutase [Bacteroides fragilis str. S6L5]MBX6680120.1 2,3-bisphosphoglycerate-dependent phosphoglycerate mutase [Chlamydia gallinacea]MBX6687352.1 2,3-bisphosphoglycerate-dependent phosphoglycerate mutase [Chlamydia gallinacea]
MTFLILLRHGKSVWNEKNLFTGWVDIPLSQQGIDEAQQAGHIIRDFPIDCIFTSSLVRSLMTALLAMTHHNSKKIPYIIHDDPQHQLMSKIYSNEESNMIPLYRSSALNERMYGELQGKNKEETAKQFGEEQVRLWRRSYKVAPPQGESLYNTGERTIPYFQKNIVPLLKNGKHVFVSAHGNSLRSLIMDIEKLSEEEVLSLEIPTGKPLIYSWTNHTFERYPGLSG